MPKQWIEHSPPEIPVGLRAFAQQHRLAAQVLARRGVSDSQRAQGYLDPHAYTPASPYELPGMQAAAQRVLEATQKGERIGVWGDFDVDGQTATAMLVGALRQRGADVLYHIPSRSRESHGVHPAALNAFLDTGVRLLLTCDTGIDAVQQTAAARQRGVDVIITDHHSLPPELPQANAIVNPHLLAEESHPLSTLPGAGVAYQLVQALSLQDGETPEEIEDLAALAIVADVARIFGDTRYLLQRGILALRQARRVSLAVLMEMAELNPTALNEEHVGFVLAPRLNALGRLGDASPMVEFYLSQDAAFVRSLCQQMEALNAHRKLLGEQVYQAAQAQIERERSLLDQAALVLAYPGWHAGVLGTVASRLAETYQKPALLISLDPQTGAGRGSARSGGGVDVTAALAQQAHLLERFGGHPAAAGFAIQSERVDEFRRAFSRTILSMTGGQPPLETLEIEGYLALKELDLALAQEVEALAPFGVGFPLPVFACRNLALRTRTPIGKGGEHLKLVVEDDSGVQQEVLFWQGAGKPLPQERFDLAFTLRASTYQGRNAMQIVYVDGRTADSPTLDISAYLKTQVAVEDCRADPDPLQRLLRSAPDEAQIWCEGQACAALPEQIRARCRTRLTLQPGETLVLWISPPGAEVLKAVLETVQPHNVLLFAVAPPEATPQAFLRQLAGLVKYALRAEAGKTNLARLAAATAQRPSAVQAGLEWLAGRGDISLHIADAQNAPEICLQIPAQPNRDEEAANRAWQKLAAVLEETAAYRVFYQRALPDVLF